MLEVVGLQPEGTLVDIGSGDGRVIIEAAVKCPELKKARGIELDEALMKLSQRRIIEGVAGRARVGGSEEDFRQKSDTATALRERVEIIHADFMQVDMCDANVVVLFFLPHEEDCTITTAKIPSRDACSHVRVSYCSVEARKGDSDGAIHDGERFFVYLPVSSSECVTALKLLSVGLLNKATR